MNYKTTPVDLSKLSHVVNNEVVEKTVYEELVKNVNAFQTTDTSNLVKKADYNIKIGDIGKVKLKLKLRVFLGWMYFIGDDGYQSFLVFAPMLSSLTIQKLPAGYRPEYHLKKLNHFTLTLKRPCLIMPMAK